MLKFDELVKKVYDYAQSGKECSTIMFAIRQFEKGDVPGQPIKMQYPKLVVEDEALIKTLFPRGYEVEVKTEKDVYDFILKCVRFVDSYIDSKHGINWENDKYVDNTPQIIKDIATRRDLTIFQP